MLKKKIQALNVEVSEEYNNAEKKSIVTYVLMDPEERYRTHLPRIPPSFKVTIALVASVDFWGKCNKTFYSCNIQIFVIS
jgi:hypothetical protein